VPVNMAEYSMSVSVQTKRLRVTELLTADSVPPIDILRRMRDFYGDESVDSSTVRRCVASFRDVSQNLSDKRRIGSYERYYETPGELKASLRRFRRQMDHPVLQYDNTPWQSSAGTNAEVWNLGFHGRV
jgi:hypothetical protein